MSSDNEHANQEQLQQGKNQSSDSNEQDKNTHLVNKYASVNLKHNRRCKIDLIPVISSMVKNYLGQIRQCSKKVSFDTHSKNQIMYIFHKLTATVASIDEEIPEKDQISWVESKLNICSSEYRLYKYISKMSGDPTQFNCTIREEDEDKIIIIKNQISSDIEKNQSRHIAELFLVFIKRLSWALANSLWKKTKIINHEHFNTILRNLDIHGVNPLIFDEIYEFGSYCEEQGRKK
jgi:hypothetical protein